MIRRLYRTSGFQLMHHVHHFASSQTHYDTLGVQKSSTYSEIRSAFIELSKKYHPDKTHGDSEMFKKINEAYSVLSQVETRQLYDDSLMFGAKRIYRSSPTDNDWAMWEREYTPYRRTMDFRRKGFNDNEIRRLSRVVSISTALIALFTYFICMYTFFLSRRSIDFHSPRFVEYPPRGYHYLRSSSSNLLELRLWISTSSSVDAYWLVYKALSEITSPALWRYSPVQSISQTKPDSLFSISTSLHHTL
ncbi:unnamed protein product [Heterobilharzia americana]|nr:unnamed protein product [Heterobilharzia americana]